MTRYAFAACLLVLVTIAISDKRTSAADEPVTFNKHVLPILQKNCQSCHRPGQIAPMSLVTFRDARPWARAMKTKVGSRQMPPWFADPKHGTFANDRSLSQRDIDVISKWADGGAVEGDPKDGPTPIEWPADGWPLKPDIIVPAPECRVPAHTKNDVVEWVTYVIPSGFTRDTWITSVEIKPSVLSVTHHICFTFQPHRPTTKYYVANWSEAPRDEEGTALGNSTPAPPRAPPGTPTGRQAGTGVGGGFNCYVPGRVADDYRPFGAGKLIPAGTDISFQVHYTPIGKEGVDRPVIGFTVSEQPPAKRWMSYGITGGGTEFAIPPNEPNYKSPPFDIEFTADAELVEFMPHMHVRGKDMTYRLVYPDGREQIVLNVPKYDFNWQLQYQPSKPIRVPKGTKRAGEANHANDAGTR